MAPSPPQPFPPGTTGLWASESADQNWSLPTSSTPALISLPFTAACPAIQPFAWLPGSTLPKQHAGGDGCAKPRELQAPLRSCETRLPFLHL